MDQVNRLKNKERKIRAQFKYISEPSELEIRNVEKSYLHIHLI